ncbi:MipA/OmpV family protein [Thalassospira mesophila]|uniref:MipA/OmpV family protein n=1 Tax=Thalassospira mesophila TaxID=1293891 RepID=UPI000A1E164D|nr:MipA/OmpV family protein [Thalassospira mesophila]
MRLHHLRYCLLPVCLAVVTLPVAAKANSDAPIYQPGPDPLSHDNDPAREVAQQNGSAGDNGDMAMPGNNDTSASNASYRDQWLKGHWSLGAVGNVKTSPYRGADDYDLGGLPWISFDSERLHVGIDGIKAKIVQGNWGSVSILGNVRQKPFDDGDSDYLRGLHDRDWAFETGVAYDRDLGPGKAHIEYLHDVSGEHDGQQADATYKVPFETGRFHYEVGGGVMWRDSDLNDYYVGVEPGEARAGRAAYAPDSAFLPHLDASVGFQLTRQMLLRANASATFLPDEYKDSSIIEDDVIYGLGLGLVYKF